MVPRQLFEEGLKAFQDSLSVQPEDRPKIQLWLENWLVKVATEKPGPWAAQFKPRLVSLSKTIDIEYDKHRNRFQVTCGPADSETLVLLTRGTMWFDGIDRIESELVRVISHNQP